MDIHHCSTGWNPIRFPLATQVIFNCSRELC